ncbi:hypothetical protein TPHA_0P00860 [Tetrapisispora phaffii CBS 4417]|uniref:Uncharacterized protein n=1 Tax=Tetrapisispora phaffii (strain ATCC 24235 / CBS 4417 / NBRC 1672 / NRRL Y-8282 / UCD 70-5) TaxID=1071381 RepID=G8C266_TETPH|nr:hypothetical protein TPHA_0P00860 [Tetrapisispora phaffii CBS 4417]CCE66244.1 hypothetical protein TPHA_0P00860 [Tetrapisispora phaffii CBS 4417]
MQAAHGEAVGHKSVGAMSLLEKSTETPSGSSSSDLPVGEHTANTNDTSMSANSERHGMKSRDASETVGNLNYYALNPTTVPPFVLDEDFKRLKTRNSNLLNTDTIFEDKSGIDYGKNVVTRDPFLNSDVEKWGQLVTNVGNHVTYISDQQTKTRMRSSQDMASASMVSAGGSSSMMDRVFDDEVQLNDLSSEWGGEERLNGVYNQPLFQNYHEVKNTMNNREWYEYISKIKDFYYQDGYNKHKQEAGRDGYADRAGQSDWLDEFSKEKERWRRFRKSKYQKWRPLVTELILNSHYVPLAFRLMIVILCAISLGIASRIFINSDDNSIASIDGRITQQASTVMAICVNSFAIVYSVYIAHDEFTGRPLGLRDPLRKLGLILLDLLFVIFSSANLALAFNTLFDPKWVCIDDTSTGTAGTGSNSKSFPKVAYICRKQRALSAFLFILMFTWVVTYAITIFRVVQRVRSQSPRF